MNKKQYNTEKKKLFNEWKKNDYHNNQSFITDGIVDFDKWNKSKKILVLLKEAYGEDKFWDLADLINCEDRDWLLHLPHYKMLSMWLHVLNNTTSDIRPKKRSDFDTKQSDHYLLSSAVINIKKSRGKSSSNNKEIHDYAIKDKDFLKRQIELISPNIILCGNTAYSLFCGIFDIEDYSQYYMSEYCLDFNGMTIIDFWHPSRKNGREQLYCNKLGKDFQKYLQLKKEI